MKEIKIEEEPKLQFNRGNPDSPVPPGIDDHDLTRDDEDQTTGVESNEDTDKDEEKSTDDQDKKKIKGNKTKNTERLTF
jgi:hypothetical protein